MSEEEYLITFQAHFGLAESIAAQLEKAAENVRALVGKHSKRNTPAEAAAALATADDYERFAKILRAGVRKFYEEKGILKRASNDSEPEKEG